MSVIGIQFLNNTAEYITDNGEYIVERMTPEEFVRIRDNMPKPKFLMVCRDENVSFISGTIDEPSQHLSYSQLSNYQFVACTRGESIHIAFAYGRKTIVARVAPEVFETFGEKMMEL